ncbi:hypothetical protein D3C76_1803310 [compost metagenome]
MVEDGASNGADFSYQYFNGGESLQHNDAGADVLEFYGNNKRITHVTVSVERSSVFFHEFGSIQ